MSVTSINTSNGSGITATSSTGDVNINSLVAGLNGIVISGGTGKQSIISASDVDFNSVSLDSASGKTVKLIADSTLANNDVYTLPSILPSSNGLILSSDTSGVMSWSIGGGGVTNPLSENLDANNKNINKVAKISILDTTANKSTSFIASTQTTDITYTLPSIAPTAGQVLSSDNTGVMSWITVITNGLVTNPMSTNLDCNNLDINNINKIDIQDTTRIYNSSIIGATQTANITYTLPTALPISNGQILSSDVSGAMSWVNSAGINYVVNLMINNLLGNDYNIDNLNNFTCNQLTTNNVSIFNKNTTPNKTILTISNSQTTNDTYTLPLLPTTTKQVLLSNASGVMSWDIPYIKYKLNTSATLTSHPPGLYVIVPLLTIDSGTYLVNVNWKFATSCIFDAGFYNQLYTALNFNGDISGISTNTNVVNSGIIYSNATIISSALFITTASSQLLYVVCGILKNSNITLQSNVIDINVILQKIA